MILKTNKGLSLVEIVIALAISSVLAIVAGQFFSDMTQFKKRQEDNVNIALEHYIGNKVMWQDFRGASASFNVLNLPVPQKIGDQGEVLNKGEGKNFYEYSFDEPCLETCSLEAETAGSCQSNCRRSITLKLEPGQTTTDYFYIMTKDSGFAQGIGNGSGVAEPLNTVSVIPENLYTLQSFNNRNAQSTSDPVVYQKNNLVTELTDKLKIGAADLDDKLLLFYAPNPIRYLEKNHSTGRMEPNYNKAPKLYHLLTNVSSNGNDAPNFSQTINNIVQLGSGIINDEIAVASGPRGPASHSLAGGNPTGVDRFMRFLPGIHGTVPLVLVEPVSLVRYSITYPVDESGNYETDRTVLVREILSKENGTFAFAQKFELSIGVISVTFSRENISSPVVSYSTSFPKENNLDF
jgi:prepilin-type N-terminal cleavage/methylation domain-containing protein